MWQEKTLPLPDFLEYGIVSETVVRFLNAQNAQYFQVLDTYTDDTGKRFVKIIYKT